MLDSVIAPSHDIIWCQMWDSIFCYLVHTFKLDVVLAWFILYVTDKEINVEEIKWRNGGGI